MERPTSIPPAPTTNSNRWAYGIFTLGGILLWIISEDRSMAFTFLGIALVADPFDQAVMWKDRPKWQRAWLIAHLGLTAAALGWMIGLGDRF